MDPSNNPIKPPAGSETKKASGSFIKRNNWLLIIGLAVILVGAGLWYAYKKVRAITHEALNNMGTVHNDTLKEVMLQKDTVFTKAYAADANVAELDLRTGPASYHLSDTTNSLFIANAREFHNKFRFAGYKENDRYVLELISNNGHQFKSTNNTQDSVNIKLNLKPEWMINVDVSASSLDMDLSKFKVRSVKVNGGAGDYKLKLGPPVATTSLLFETGVSEIDVAIPKNVACQIKTDTQLSANTFDGFDDKGNGEYETKGFATAKNKILIEFKGGISDYKVTRY